MSDPDNDDQRALRPNKTQLKREIAARSALAEKMTMLSDAELRRLGMQEALIEAVASVRAIKPSGARKRQLKHCVKCLQGADLTEVEMYLNDRRSHQVAANQALHRLESWRDRLVEEGDGVIGELLCEYPDLDRQQLRQMVRDARREKERGKPAGAGRKLFRYLRTLSEAEPGN